MKFEGESRLVYISGADDIEEFGTAKRWDSSYTLDFSGGRHGLSFSIEVPPSDDYAIGDEYRYTIEKITAETRSAGPRSRAESAPVPLQANPELLSPDVRSYRPTHNHPERVAESAGSDGRRSAPDSEIFEDFDRVPEWENID